MSTSVTYALMSLCPSARATDTRWWPSLTKWNSPIRYTSIGGMPSPRRCAARCAPSACHAARGGAKAAVELAAAVDRAHDRVERDRLLAEAALAAAAEGVQYLLEGQDHVHVAWLAAQACGELRERSVAARAPEVELGVGLRHSGVARRHSPKITTRRARGAGEDPLSAQERDLALFAGGVAGRVDGGHGHGQLAPRRVRDHGERHGFALELQRRGGRTRRRGSACAPAMQGWPGSARAA